MNDQENIKRIKVGSAVNDLVHLLSAEMLTMKKEIEELKDEVKLNQLRHEDEIKDAYDNIKLLKNQTQILIMEMKESRKHRKEDKIHIDERTRRITNN
tara:strand:+ start:691 stop:984 length:294 start_codon:yes stop_codon:yes gene_type:complete